MPGPEWDIFADGLAEEDEAGARERIIARRTEDGLPVDEDIVDRLLRGEGRTHEIEWLTDEELAEEEGRDGICERVEQYVADHAADAFGGLWVGPRKTVHVAFARDADHHAAALAARLPEDDRPWVDVVPVARTERELEAVMDRLDRDHDELEALGIRMDAFGPDVVENVVVVDALVDHPDRARRLLAERYGDAVRASLATPDQLVEAVAWQLYDEPEPGHVTVRYAANAAYVLERVDVDETADAIRITVHERAPGVVSTLAGTTRTATVELSGPVGDRPVIDGATGRRRDRAPTMEPGPG
jgi:hypothetical protein